MYIYIYMYIYIFIYLHILYRSMKSTPRSTAQTRSTPTSDETGLVMSALKERCPARQTSRVQRLEAKVGSL